MIHGLVLSCTLVLGAAEPAKPGHWAFQPIQNPTAPSVRDAAWCRTSIDRFILAKLEAAGVPPAAAADRRAWIRRATFDLTGLPPTAEEIDAFLADTSANADERLVNRLLDSRHYGEHWGRHWLDVVRYADTAGETADYPVPVAWRYRNYVIDAFNADKPYDEFLREQIAGDILARRGPRERYAERVTATGYLAISRRFGFDSENYHHLTIQDTLDNLGQSVLGLTLGCARCHAHKYDPVSMPDYYALYGIFDSTRYAFPGSEQKQKHRALVPLVPPEESQAQWRAFESRLASLTKTIERGKGSVPAAVLRSLDDLDGDFEMQAPAAGGSKGVLVPPWIYEGPIAVTTEAQSPFKNLHPFGKVGASLPAGTNAYRITQTLYPRRSRAKGGLVHVNLDFKVMPSPSASPPTPVAESHRFWMGGSSTNPAFEVLLSSTAIVLRTGDASEVLRTPGSNQWHNLQLTVDLAAATLSGRIGHPDDLVHFPPRPLAKAWTGQFDALGFEANPQADQTSPGLLVDNLGILDTAIPPVATVVALELPTHDGPNAAPTPAEVEAAKKELERLLAEGPFAMAYAVSEGTPHNARVQLRGEPDKPGEEIPRGFLPVLGGGVVAPDSAGSGRLELADWLTNPTNPLTARVMVNRIWQYHFGEALVKTPNDFGARGQRPSHPELLDHLATEFIRSGWSIKAMHRWIMGSATYRQESHFAPGFSVSSVQFSAAKGSSGAKEATNECPVVATPPHGQAIATTQPAKTESPKTEPLPTLFSPFPRRRLAAEETRDAILRVSGTLDPSPGEGHPFPAPTGWGYTQHGPFSAVYDHRRRSVYLMTQRIKRHPFLALFDGADPNAGTPERRTTTVPTQALFFLNDPFVHANAEKFAQRVFAGGENEAQRIEVAYRLALGRKPDAIERAEAVEFLAAYRAEIATLPAPVPSADTKANAKANEEAEAVSTKASYAALARVLFGSNEFLAVD